MMMRQLIRNYLEFIMATMNKDKMLSKERMAQAFAVFDQVN